MNKGLIRKNKKIVKDDVVNVVSTNQSISILEKECICLLDLIKEINALIKDKAKRVTANQLIEHAAKGLLKLRISSRFARFLPLKGDFLVSRKIDNEYKNNVLLSPEECLELRHNRMIEIIRDKKIATTLTTRDSVYILKADKDEYMAKIIEEYKKQNSITVNDNSAPPFFAEQHKYFAPELKLAVEAWLDIFTDEKIKHNKGVKLLLKEWLKKHNHILTATQIKRIATIITPESRKEGGAKKI